MTRFAALFLTALFAVQTSCDSEDNSQTYEFSGVWMFSGVKELCSQPLPEIYGGGSVEFDTIRVKVFKSQNDKDPVAIEAVDCNDGSFTVDGLARGSYFVVVEAMAEDPSEDIELDAGPDASTDPVSDTPVTRAYYAGNKTVVVPTGDEAAVKFDMRINTGSIEVGWDFERGACATDRNNVATVRIELKAGSALNDEDSGLVDCEINGQTYLFEDLAWDVYRITVTGMDPDGVATHMGMLDTPLEIRPGTNISVDDAYIELIPIAD